MTVNIQTAFDFTKSMGTKIKTALAPYCKKLCEIYSDYDINVTRTSHLTPNKFDEEGNELNVVTNTSNKKLRISVKDILCAFVGVTIVLTILYIIAKIIFSD